MLQLCKNNIEWFGKLVSDVYADFNNGDTIFLNLPSIKFGYSLEMCFLHTL